MLYLCWLIPAILAGIYYGMVPLGTIHGAQILYRYSDSYHKELADLCRGNTTIYVRDPFESETSLMITNVYNKLQAMSPDKGKLFTYIDQCHKLLSSKGVEDENIEIKFSDPVKIYRLQRMDRNPFNWFTYT